MKKVFFLFCSVLLFSGCTNLLKYEGKTAQEWKQEYEKTKKEFEEADQKLTQCNAQTYLTNNKEEKIDECIKNVETEFYRVREINSTESKTKPGVWTWNDGQFKLELEAKLASDKDFCLKRYQ